MALRKTYEDFLSRANASALTEKASLNYITTLTTINTANAIEKHFSAHEKVLRKKAQKVLYAVEGSNALCVEVETTIEFLSGGGAYLPNLDDNFLADRVVTFPVIHIVNYDAAQKIQSIRLHWDQGSLLKQVEIIGSRARQWPIRDGKDQARLIASSATASEKDIEAGPSANGSNGANVGSPTKTSQRRQTATKDPHASLSLFTPRDENEPEERARGPKATHKPPPRDYHELFARQDEEAPARERSVSPHKDFRPKSSSAKPPPREMHELFVGPESDASPGTKQKLQSPEKGPFSPGNGAPKGGTGKNYRPMRVFDPEQGEDTGSPTKSDNVFKKPDPKKYNHFEFADSDDIDPTKAAQPSRPINTKHQSQWDFGDFNTPEKYTRKIRSQDVRHFGLGAGDEELDNSPAKKPIPRARPDNQPQFDFKDDGAPENGERRPAGHPRGAGKINTGESLYIDHILGDPSSPGASEEKKSHHPLSTVTNIKDRSKDFDPHFSIADSSPGANSSATTGNRNDQPLDPNRARAVKMMDAQWEVSDRSPSAQKNPKKEFPVAKGKENYSVDGFGNKNLGITTQGDGMGDRKGGGNRGWMFGDEEEEGGKEVRKPLQRKVQQGMERHWDF